MGVQWQGGSAKSYWKSFERSPTLPVCVQRGA